MTMVKKLVTAAVVSLLCVPAAAADASDPLDGLIEEKIVLEVQQAPASDLFLLLGDIAQTNFVLDPCVQGTLTFRLEDVTVATVLEVVADALWLRYDAAEDGIAVRCDAVDGEPTRVDLQVVDAPLSDVLDELAEASALTLHAHDCEALRIDLDLHNAPLRAVLRELAAQADADLDAGPNRIDVRCARAS